MTRQEYMQQLAALLAAMPEAERRDARDCRRPCGL